MGSYSDLPWRIKAGIVYEDETGGHPVFIGYSGRDGLITEQPEWDAADPGYTLSKGIEPSRLQLQLNLFAFVFIDDGQSYR